MRRSNSATKSGKMVSASASSGRLWDVVGGGVWRPVAVVRPRLALQRGQLLAETGISLPQRLQNIGMRAYLCRNAR